MKGIEDLHVGIELAGLGSVLPPVGPPDGHILEHLGRKVDVRLPGKGMARGRST